MLRKRLSQQLGEVGRTAAGAGEGVGTPKRCGGASGPQRVRVGQEKSNVEQALEAVGPKEASSCGIAS